MISLATNLAEVPLHRPASLKKSISSHVPDGKFPFLETLNKHEPNQFCQISLRKRPVCPRFPPIPLSASGLPRRGSGGSDLTLNVRFSCL